MNSSGNNRFLNQFVRYLLALAILLGAYAASWVWLLSATEM